MTEYIGRTATIRGGLTGDVAITTKWGGGRIVVLTPAADLLGWLRAQGLVVVSQDALQEYVDARAEEDAIQQEAERTGQTSYSGRLGRAMFELGRAITDATTTKEGESNG